MSQLKGRFTWVVLLGALSFFAAGLEWGPSSAEVKIMGTDKVLLVPPKWKAPIPPEHSRRSLETASELAEDLAAVVKYLEAGQSYYRAYQSGTHTVEENADFLKFLERYEQELNIAKKEAPALRKWVFERGAMDTPVGP